MMTEGEEGNMEISTNNDGATVAIGAPTDARVVADADVIAVADAVCTRQR